ncbi:hypothetical protein B1J92_A00154g [Nakaseomyces glabratus]|nr:hypothetical protein J7293_00006 [Nakaseomyces glabratus]KAH7610103.1 hypothetical protein J7294_00006 [Nakaseomyces glabratus]OXB45275.1 hypothetical protein B1J91_A00154g [Nakaseomyces glabratus]OXB50572.1 hypothetical protein B1J92_A00154g [Nakaseomyces glabratus]
MNTYVSSRHQLQTVCSTLTYLYLDREDPLRTVFQILCDSYCLRFDSRLLNIHIYPFFWEKNGKRKDKILKYRR